MGLNNLGRRKGVDPAAAVAERFVLVDPAGLKYVRKGRRGAGGVSQVLYDWLGWGPDGQFPHGVANQLAGEGDAACYTYPANVSSVSGLADFASKLVCSRTVGSIGVRSRRTNVFIAVVKQYGD